MIVSAIMFASALNITNVSEILNDVMTQKKMKAILPSTKPLIEEIIIRIVTYKSTTRHLKPRAKENSTKKA